MWVVVLFGSEVRISRCRWGKEEGLRWVDNQGAQMSWGYGPIFVVPLKFVIWSRYVNNAVLSAVSGAFREGFWSIGAQMELSNG